MARRIAGAALAAALLLLTGCAASPAPAATPTPATTPTSTPTPTVEPVVVPTIPFDGDCTQVLTAEQLDGLLGAGWMTRDELFQSYGEDAPVNSPKVDSLGTLGGLACWWYGVDAPMSLGVTILPPASVPEQFSRDYAAVRCDPSYDGPGCRLSVTENGTWIMAAVYSPEEAEEELLQRTVQAVADTVGGPLEARAADRQPGWWTLPDCVRLGEDMALEELLGESYVNGFWEGAEAPEQTLLGRAGVEIYCPWFTNHEQNPGADITITDLTLAAGAARNWQDIRAASGAEAITVDGAAEAVFIKYPPNGEGTLYATDGVNVLVSRGTLDFATQMAERALAALAD